MAAKSNGEPHVSVVNFGTYYCAMWRWDDADHWKFLNNKTGGRRLFESASLAINETIRILKKREPVAATASPSEPDMITAWRKEKAQDTETERASVFGGGKPKIVWANGRAVPVERRRIA